ncbi:MAG: hypothetical protein JXB10_12975 [Pirellulales bacterium]|nr:hypothetical protein [Pirellulales bacterium]
MAKKILPFVTAVLAMLLLPALALAQDAKRPAGPPPQDRPHRPNPQGMFQRLDVNKDGAVTKDEIPDGMPQRLKMLLRRADRDDDQRITPKEFRAALQAVRGEKAGPRPEAAAEGRHRARDGKGPEARRGPGPKGPKDRGIEGRRGPGPKGPMAQQFKGLRSPRPEGPPAWWSEDRSGPGPRGPMARGFEGRRGPGPEGFGVGRFEGRRGPGPEGPMAWRFENRRGPRPHGPPAWWSEDRPGRGPRGPMAWGFEGRRGPGPYGPPAWHRGGGPRVGPEVQFAHWSKGPAHRGCPGRYAGWQRHSLADRPEGGMHYRRHAGGPPWGHGPMAYGKAAPWGRHMAFADRMPFGPDMKGPRHVAAQKPSGVVVPRLKALFNRLDRNQDGALEFREFVAIARVFHAAKSPGHPPMAPKALKARGEKKPPHAKHPADRGAKRHHGKDVKKNNP